MTDIIETPVDLLWMEPLCAEAFPVDLIWPVALEAGGHRWAVACCGWAFVAVHSEAVLRLPSPKRFDGLWPLISAVLGPPAYDLQALKQFCERRTTERADAHFWRRSILGSIYNGALVRRYLLRFRDERAAIRSGSVEANAPLLVAGESWRVGVMPMRPVGVPREVPSWP